MSDFNNFFDVKPIVAEQQETVITEFRPNPKKGQNGIYKAVVRFLPNPSDPANKSVISKYVAFIKDPNNPQGSTTSVDCPSTIGAQDPIQTTFFALRGSANPVLQENSKQFSRKQQYASLVQVLSCDAAPQLVNKILVWKYGIKIYEKITVEMNPPMGEGHNPFNLLTGRPFAVNVKEVSGFPNYDACNFFDLDITQSGMRVITNNAQGQPQIYVVTPETIANEQGKALVFNYLKDNAPDTSKYEYHAWTAETQQFVNRCIQVYSNPQATLQAMSAAQNPGVNPIQSVPTMTQAAAQPMQMPSMPQMSNTPVGVSGLGNPMPTMPAGGNTQPFSAPAAATAPSMPIDPMVGFTIPSAPAAPTMGLGDPMAGTMPTVPGNFGTPELPSDVNALLDNVGPKKPAGAAPAMGLDLSDVLNGQIIGQ